MKLDKPRPRPEEPDHPFVGSLVYQGVAIDVEHRKGSYRSGTSDEGVEWRTKMPAVYGEVRDTTGADGDAVDVYVGDDPFATHVWVIQTKFPGGKDFDETKAMLGFATRDDALRTFRSAYDKPGFLLSVVRWKIGAWVEAMKRPQVHGGRMAKPLTKARLVMPDRIPGGLADGKTPKDFDPSALARGIKVEMEHTSDRAVAREIAMDHLTEDPRYYEHLEKMETGMRKGALARIGEYFRRTKTGKIVPVLAHERRTNSQDLAQSVHLDLGMEDGQWDASASFDTDGGTWTVSGTWRGRAKIALGSEREKVNSLSKSELSAFDAALAKRVNSEKQLWKEKAARAMVWRREDMNKKLLPHGFHPHFQSQDPTVDLHLQDHAVAGADHGQRVVPLIMRFSYTLTPKAMAKGTRMLIRGTHDAPLRLVMRVPMAKGRKHVGSYMRGGRMVMAYDAEARAGAATAAPASKARKPQPEPEPVPGRAWVPKLDHLPTDTQQHHRRGGSYTPERAALHKTIVDGHFQGGVGIPREGHQKTAVVMMGGTASGKSTCVKMRGITNMVHVDADHVKGHLPEYVEAVKGNARNAAMLAHEESSEVAKVVRDRAISEGRNLLMDGTGKNGPKYRKFVDHLKSQGYHVTVLYVHNDLETALPRARERAEKRGRYVPEEFIKSAYDNIPHNFRHVADGADDFHVFDSRPTPTRYVWGQEGGQESVEDPQFVEQFKVSYWESTPKS